MPLTPQNCFLPPDDLPNDAAVLAAAPVATGVGQVHDGRRVLWLGGFVRPNAAGEEARNLSWVIEPMHRHRESVRDENACKQAEQCMDNSALGYELKAFGSCPCMVIEDVWCLDGPALGSG